MLRVDRCRDMDELIKLWINFDEIQWVDSRGGLDELITF